MSNSKTSTKKRHPHQDRPKVKLDRKAVIKQKAVLAIVLPIVVEYHKRQHHQFYQYIPDDSPDRNQVAFHQSDAPNRIIIGGNQSGKSRAVAQEIAWWLVPGSHPYLETPPKPKIWVLSASYRTLKEGVYRHLKEILPSWKIKRWNAQIPVPGLSMPSGVIMDEGGELDFISGIGTEEARKKVQAAACHLIAIDEEIGGGIVEEVQQRRLATGGKMMVSATAVRSDDWLLKMEDEFEAGNKNYYCVEFDTRAAVRAGHVNAEIFKERELALSKEDRMVRLYGKTRRRQGLIYPEFNQDNICEPFDIPEEWTRYCALDPGWRTFAAVWAAIAPDGVMYIYRELYEHTTFVGDINDLIRKAEGWGAIGEAVSPSGHVVRQWEFVPGVTEYINSRLIDPSAYGTEVSGEMKVGNLLARDHGLICAKAQNFVDLGIQMMKRRMLKGLDGRVRLKVFDNCIEWLKERSKYRWKSDQKRREANEKAATPVKRDDHLMDATRYIELGGSEFINPENSTNPHLMAIRERMPQIRGCSEQTKAALQGEWEKIMKGQKKGSAHGQQHVGGLGTEW